MITLRNETTAQVRSLFNLSSVSWSQGKNGCLKLTVKARLDRAERSAYYNNDAIWDLRFTFRGRLVWRGRTEIVKLMGDQLEITALGNFRYFNDPVYHAVWSMTKYDSARPVEPEEFSLRNSKMYTMDRNNRLFIGLTKNTIYRPVNDAGMLCLRFPLGTVRSILGFQALLKVNLPADWIVQFPFMIPQANGTYVYTGTIGYFNNAGGTYEIPVFYSGGTGSAKGLAFETYNNAGANYTYLGENGGFYAKVTELRVVTENGRVIDVAMTAGITAGINVLCTVTSTTNMYVGQRLWIGANATTGEIVTVTSVVSSTQFRANFVNNYAAGTKVQAHVIFADEIAADLLFKAKDYNPDRLDPNALITSPKVDLFERQYYGERFDAVLNSLTPLGNNASPSVQYKAEIRADNIFRFLPKTTDSRTWQIYLKEIEIQKLLDTLATEVQSEWDTTIDLPNTGLSYSSPDPLSVARYGLNRAGYYKANTTSEVEAKIEGDAILQDKKILAAQAAIVIDKILTPQGAPALVEDVAPYDTCVLANLPGSISPSIEKIRRFMVSETEITLDEKGQRIRIIPDLPIPALEFLLIRDSLKR